jgi:plasmid maintenance system antidote protein VapI
MVTQKTPTPADLRALVARKRVHLYEIAPQVGINPTHIGRMLNGRVSMTDDIAQRIMAALEGKGDA